MRTVPYRNMHIVFFLVSPERSPIKRCRQHPVRYDLRRSCVLTLDQLVRLCSVAATMCKLKVVYVGRVSTFGHRDDMVHGSTQRVGCFQAEVHRLPTDGTHSLCREYPLLILFKLGPMRSFLVRSVRHNLHQRKRPSLCPVRCS